MDRSAVAVYPQLEAVGVFSAPEVVLGELGARVVEHPCGQAGRSFAEPGGQVAQSGGERRRAQSRPGAGGEDR